MDEGEKMSQNFVHGVAGSYTNYRKLWRERRVWKSGCDVFLSVPAVNRDSDSYKQPLLASSKVMIGLMRHLGDGFIHQLIPPTHGTGLWAPMVAPAPNVSGP
jgi:hypothetical protein